MACAIRCALLTLLLSATAQADVPLDRINSELPEYGVVEGPDGYYFSRSSEPFGTPGKEQILLVPKNGGLDQPPDWTDRRYSEGDPYFSPDGNRLCFVSDRPAEADPNPGDPDIWCMQREADAWSEPQRLPEPANSASVEFSPVLAGDGYLYFSSNRESGMGDLYRGRQDDAGQWQVENLGPAINGPLGEWNLDISPDGELLVFEASHRKSNISVSGDLYLSRKTPGGWSPPIPLSKLNTRGSQLVPRFLSNTRMTYSSSNADEGNDDAAVLDVQVEDFLPVVPVLLAVSRSAHELVLLDPDDLSVRQRVAIGTGPHEIASSLDGRLAIVPSHGVYPAPHPQPIAPGEMRWETSISSGYAVVDLANLQVADFSLEGCVWPHGIAISAQGNRAWFTCEDEAELREVNPVSGEVAWSVPLAKGVHKVMYLQESGLLVTSNPAAGEASIINLDSREVIGLPTGKGAEALAASRDERDIWVANGFEATVCRINAGDRTLAGCWPSGGKFPIALAVDATRSLLWVARSASSDVAALSLETLEPVREFTLPSTPLGMALDEPGGRLYLTLPRLNQVVMLDVDSGEIIARADGVMEADDLDLVPAVEFVQAPDT